MSEQDYAEIYRHLEAQIEVLWFRFLQHVSCRLEMVGDAEVE